MGQVLQRQAPEQSGATPYTAYEYYPDGSLKKSTDARGAYAMLNYNKRGLTTLIDYTVSGDVETTEDVTFSYDVNGNRETMTDGAGSVSYMYNTLNRMLSETRTFTGLSGSFTLSYEYYNSTGQLKKITDPFGDSVSYEYDLAGRTRNITGSAFAGVTSYATNINYRAWDGAKSLTSDNGASTATMGYDSSMRINSFQMGGVNANYSYFADDKLNTVTNPSAPLLDRNFNYYHPRGSMSYSGAFGVANATQFYQYTGQDVFGNFSSRSGRYWWMQTNTTFTSINNYVNNKLSSGTESGQAISATHDFEGNVLTTMQGTTQPLGPNKYDAASRFTSARSDGVQTKFYDGDGNVVKDERIYFDGQGSVIFNNQFMLISSVLGGKPYSIVKYDGTKLEMSVYGSGQILARQKIDISTPTVTFFHRDPHNTIDFTGETKWIDPMGTLGKAADAAYIAQFQNGNYNYGSNNVVYSGFSYMGNYTNQNPAQSTVCKDGLTTVNCGSLFQGIRNGQFSNIWFRTTGLAGYDENTTQLAASFGLSASMKNGVPTSAGVARNSENAKSVLPSEKLAYSITAVFEDGTRQLLEKGVEAPPELNIDTVAIKKIDYEDQFKERGRKFFEVNKTCTEIINARAKQLQRGTIENTIDNTHIIDVTVSDSRWMIDRGSLHDPPFISGLRLGHLLRYQREPGTAWALADWQSQKAKQDGFRIFFGSKYRLKGETNDGKITPPHEYLHVLFQAGHKVIAFRLGLIPDGQDWSEDKASREIDAWLRRGCK